MIEVQQVSKEEKVKNKKIEVLHQISLEAGNGTVTGIFGRKKTGKTILLQIITGIKKPTEGKVLIDKTSIAEDSMLARRNFGYVPELQNLFPGLTGEQYISFVADVYGVSPGEREQILSRYLSELNLEDRMKKSMVSCSKAVTKKIFLLGALIHSPSNLILDNIFDGMDSADKEAVKKLLREYARRGNSVLLADDHLTAAEGLCSNVVYMADGRLVFNGTFQNLLNQYEGAASLEIIDLMLNEEAEKLKKIEKPKSTIGLWRYDS